MREVPPLVPDVDLKQPGELQERAGDTIPGMHSEKKTVCFW